MNRSLALLSLPALLALASCASTGPQYEEKPITHTVTQDDLAFVQTKRPLTASAATLYVNGLGCPLCASNLDKQLVRIRGLHVENIDLSVGKVNVTFSGDKRPAPFNLANAVEDAGFTLVKIESK
jgi:copper chaperone CopZ